MESSEHKFAYTSSPISQIYSRLCEPDRPIRLTKCYTQFKSPGDKILCVSL